MDALISTLGKEPVGLPDDVTREILDDVVAEASKRYLVFHPTDITDCEKLILVACEWPQENDLTRYLQEKIMKNGELRPDPYKLDKRLLLHGYRYGLAKYSYERIKWLFADEAPGKIIDYLGRRNTSVMRELGTKISQSKLFGNYLRQDFVVETMKKHAVKEGYYRNVVLPFLYGGDAAKFAEELLAVILKKGIKSEDVLGKRFAHLRAWADIGDILVETLENNTRVLQKEEELQLIHTFGYAFGTRYYERIIKEENPHKWISKTALEFSPATYAYGYDAAKKLVDINVQSGMFTQRAISLLIIVSFYEEKPELARNQLTVLAEPDIGQLKDVYASVWGPHDLMRFFDFLWEYPEIRRRVSKSYNHDKTLFINDLALATHKAM